MFTKFNGIIIWYVNFTLQFNVPLDNTIYIHTHTYIVNEHRDFYV